MKNIREYIKENGRVAARLKFGNSIDDMPIKIAGCKVGVLSRYHHDQYGCWVWQATVEYNHQEYIYIDFKSQQHCLDWAKSKVEALMNPMFGMMLRQEIASCSLSIEQIAKVANCSRYVIFKWMRSESWPPIHTAKRIAAAISPMGYAPMFDIWCKQIELEQ